MAEPPAKQAAKQASGRVRLWRGLVQAAGLALFLWLLLAASVSAAEGLVPPNFFLRLDPLAAVAAFLAGRQWIAALWPALLLLGLTLFFGRVFCGWLCPLGATLDAASGLMNRCAGPAHLSAGSPARPTVNPRRVKYLLLMTVLAAALAGVNLAHWASPIPLVTRFYGLVLHPLVLLAGHEALNFSRPVFESLDWSSLSYLSLSPPRFASMYFLAALFGLIFWLERKRPRFWCAYLCPAGALLGLFSRRPLWRRRTDACNQCGKCRASCPADDGRPGECLTCQACVELCPAHGTMFSLFRGKKAEGDAAALPSRRAFLAAAAGGLTLAGLERSGLGSLLGSEAVRGILWSEALIRPPGALPEAVFLARCLRCGLCMRACPTNGLQPAWTAAGPQGVFSPVLVPRRGPCEPDCNQCGRVCPTGAITPLDLAEKRWAKIGGAVVHHNLCLAWAEDKSCMVCHEVCPYGAIEVVQAGEFLTPAPVVKAFKCSGCGYCEQHCPVRVPAITIQPLGALRLTRGSYIKAGRAAGLDLDHPPQEGFELPPARRQGGLPPGFTE